MRFIVLIALCLAVASASYSSRRQFNRLLRNLQQQQQQQDQEYGCGPQCQLAKLYGDLDEQDQDDDDEYQQNQYRQQCSRSQGCRGGLDLDDDEIQYDNDEEQDEYYGNEQYQYLNQRQGRQQPFHQQQGQQQKRQQQQRHQCTPKYQLLQALEQANTQLASKLYKQAKQENDDKNTVVSPAALQLALASIQHGARGNAQRQIQRIIGAGLNKQQSRQVHTALQQSLQGQDPMQKQTGQRQQSQIKTTTTIVINQRNRAQQKFIQAVRACLNTQVKKCNFQQQPQQCRQQINRLVAQKTQQKLQQVVPQDAITTNTKMVVVNTAQVKARWGRQFRQQQQTKQGRFFPLGSQQPKHIQVIQSQGQFNYYEDEQMQVVGIPTQQQEMTLYVMVPKNKDGLNQVEKSQIQDGQQLKQVLEQAEQQQQQVDIELPKFQIKHKLDAQQTLRKQGVQDIFEADQADLSGINGQQQQQQYRRRHQQQQYGQEYEQEQYQDEQQQQQQLHVNKLIHQATIKIDEQGIQAANPRQGPQSQSQYQPQYQQYQDQDDEQDQDEEEYDQEQQYNQQQLERQETFEQIFGQNQRRRQQRLRRNRRQQPQYQQQDQDEYDQQDQYSYGQQEEKKVKANRAFAFVLKHNPSNQIVLTGRVVDAAQRPKTNQQQRGQQQDQQSLNGVDQQ